MADIEELYIPDPYPDGEPQRDDFPYGDPQINPLVDEQAVIVQGRLIGERKRRSPGLVTRGGIPSDIAELEGRRVFVVVQEGGDLGLYPQDGLRKAWRVNSLHLSDFPEVPLEDEERKTSLDDPLSDLQKLASARKKRAFRYHVYDLP